MTVMTPLPDRPGARFAGFLLAYLAGAAAIVAAIRIPLDVPLAIGLPIAVMALYLLGSMIGQRSAASIESAADSVFQLGFLFSVTALLAALLPYALASGRPSVETILGLFAMASTTTVAGLVARVSLVRLLPSAEPATAGADPALPGRIQALGEAAETATERLLGTTGALDAFGNSLSALQQGTAEALETLSLETKELSAELKAVREAATRNEERIARIFESYEMMIGKLREAQQAGDRFQDSLGTRIADLVGALESAAGTVGTLSDGAGAAVGGLRAETEALRGTRAALADDAAAIADIRSTLGEALKVAMEVAAAGRGDSDDAALSIDEEAFGALGRRQRDDDDGYIPRLRGRPGGGEPS